VVLLVPLKLSNDLKPGSLTLKADVSWLECAAKCIPGNASVQTGLEVATASQASSDRALISQWLGKVPKTNALLQVRSWWGPAAGTSRPLMIEWTSPNQATQGDFYSDKSDDFEVDPMTKMLPQEAGKLRLEATVKKSAAEWPKQISGVLVEK